MDTSLRLPRLLVAAGFLFLLAFPASGAAASSDQTIPFSMTFPNPCTLEAVLVTGEVHTVMITNDNKADISVNWPDTSGVGLFTGTNYQANETTHFYVKGAPDGGFTIAVQDNFELVSQDSSPNLLVHMTIGISFDPRSGTSMNIDRGPGATCSG